MTANDKNALRALAARVRELSEKQNLALMRDKWRALNDGEAREPLIVMKYHGVGNEVYPALTCETDAARRIEAQLSALLTEAAWADDRVIEPLFPISLFLSFTAFGISPAGKQTALGQDGKPTLGYKFSHLLNDLDDDFKLLKASEWNIAESFAGKRRAFETAQEAIGDILSVVYQTPSQYYAPLNKLVELMGMENMLYALHDSPDNFKRALDMQTSDLLAYMDDVERAGLVMPNTDSSYLHQDSYGYAAPLPGEGWARAWGYANSQESVGISPEMFDEIVFPSIERFAARFGLFAFGCCEPVHPIWEKSLCRLKNLRKVSVSPWCDEEWIADRLRERKIVYHRKPSPNGFALPDFDEQALYNQLAKTARAARGCPLEITFRDIATVSGDPCRLSRAVEIARRAVGENWAP